MNINVALSSAAALLLLSGCASDSEMLAPLDSEQAVAEDLVCTREVHVGSRLPQKRCITRAQREKEREEAQDWLESDGKDGKVLITN